MNRSITIHHIIEKHFQIVITVAHQCRHFPAQLLIIALGHEGFGIKILHPLTFGKQRCLQIKQGQQFQGRINKLTAFLLGNPFQETAEFGSHRDKLHCIFIKYGLCILFHIHLSINLRKGTKKISQF